MNYNKSRFKIYLYFAILIVALGALFIWPKINDPNKEIVTKWSTLDVECLQNGHVNLAQHIHSNLTISVDGAKTEIPADIGILKNCMAEVHIHDNTGKIHIETAEAGKQFMLKTFFDVWGEKLNKDGYSLKMSVNNIPNEEGGDLILADNQQILLEYTKQ